MQIITFGSDSTVDGQSESVLMMAECLTVLGYRVLVCDMEYWISKCIFGHQLTKTLWDLFAGNVSALEIVIPYRGYHILPIDYLGRRKIEQLCMAADCMLCEPLIFAKPEWAYILRGILMGDELQEQYDLCLIDVGRSCEMITLALYAADTALIPIDYSEYSIRGAASIIGRVNRASQEAGRSIVAETCTIARVSKTKWGKRDKSKERNIVEHYRSYHYETTMRYGGYMDRILEGRSVWDYSRLRQDAMNLALEFLAKRNLHPRKFLAGVVYDSALGRYVYRESNGRTH